MRSWLGIDLGTSSVKVVVVGDDGTVRARGSADYSSRADGERHEQDAADYLDAAARAVESCRIDPTHAQVTGIGVVGHTPSLVAVSADGHATAPVMTWRDARAGAESSELKSALGAAEDVVGVANLWAPSHLPAKLLWLARSLPDALGETEWLLTPKDYLGFALTGEAATDPWSAKGLFSVRHHTPSSDVFELAGVSPDRLPPARDPWSRLGSTTVEGAAALGVAPGIPVAVGWSDALGGMLGIGAAAHERSFVLTGTSDIVGTSTAAQRPTSGELYRVPASVAALDIHYGPTQSSGASLVWLARVTGISPAKLVASAAAAHTGSTFVPYLAGERAPLWDPRLRGAFVGLAESDGPDEMALAVLRGVALSGWHVLERTWECAGDHAEVHIGGSNITAPGWVRARGEALARDLILHLEPQLTALGAAMLGRSAATGESIALSHDALASTTVRVPADASRAGVLRTQYLQAVQAALARRDLDHGLSEHPPT